MYEKEMIAAQNNPFALEAWRAAAAQNRWSQSLYERLHLAKEAIREGEKEIDMLRSELSKTDERIEAIVVGASVAYEDACASNAALKAIADRIALYETEEKNPRTKEFAPVIYLSLIGLFFLGVWVNLLGRV